MVNKTRISVPVEGTYPRFIKEANALALQLSQYSAEELSSVLHINAKIALENYRRLQEFHADDTPSLQALSAYTGIVFKRINPQDFTADDYQYAQEHLFITSFLYGLLRPLDNIRPYRLEGDVRLPENSGLTQFDYWKPRLTDYLIEEVKKDDGILVNLASSEMKNLFDWSRVESSVRIITPEFQVWKGDKLRTVVIYTKMCRGEMTRYMLKNRINTVSQLEQFEWEGFHIDYSRSKEENPLFTL